MAGPIQESVAADVRRLKSNSEFGIRNSEFGISQSLLTSAATIPIFLESALGRGHRRAKLLAKSRGALFIAGMRHAPIDSQSFTANRERLRTLLLKNALAVINSN